MCDYRLWGEPDGLLCTQTGKYAAHVFEATTDDIGDHGHHSDEVDL